MRVSGARAQQTRKNAGIQLAGNTVHVILSNGRRTQLPGHVVQRSGLLAVLASMRTVAWLPLPCLRDAELCAWMCLCEMEQPEQWHVRAAHTLAAQLAVCALPETFVSAVCRRSMQAQLAGAADVLMVRGCFVAAL